MVAGQPPHTALSDLDVDAALRTIMMATAVDTGQSFFSTLVRQLALTLRIDGAWVTEYLPGTRQLRALSFWMAGQYVDGFTYMVDGTPCEAVINERRMIHYPDRLQEQYPNRLMLQQYGAVSFLGTPLKAIDGSVLGHLAVLDSRPMPEDYRAVALFQIFAERAAAELERIHAETALREREEKLARLIGSTMDAIIELDGELTITLVNPAARRTLELGDHDLSGASFRQFLDETSFERLGALAREIDLQPSGRQGLWIPGGLTVTCQNGTCFPAEATLSRYDMQGAHYYTLLLRNVNERIEAEKRISSLTSETEYLREEIKALLDLEQMIGESEAFHRVLMDVQRVAETDATVLILGETGTGKELIARTVHAASSRRQRPFIKVNCAAIPATLVESEFFGHEKGAFTGATGRRQGRFALADGGTIFLDEVAELPIDLQSKLLRVLQEGEFEPVGSSRTQKVDVRVIAATNRSLHDEIAASRFRADLYYRLNVFPIQIPALRERGDDVIIMAKAFAERFARQAGRKVAQFTPACLQRLRAYGWPGNVRELRNIVERAVIASDSGMLDICALLPDTSLHTAKEVTREQEPRILRSEEIEALERRNMIMALECTGWRVSGEKGAAALLGINPSTFNSRMRALGIIRPRA